MTMKSMLFLLLLSATIFLMPGFAAAGTTPEVPGSTAATAEASPGEPSASPRPVRLEEILTGGASDPVLLSGCSVNWTCNNCSGFKSCSGTQCSAGPEDGGYVECDGVRQSCSSWPVCTTYCCVSWQGCHRYCQDIDPELVGSCPYNCCECSSL